MSTEKKSNEILTPEFRVSFPNVFKARAIPGSTGPAKFNISMLFRIKADPKKPDEPVVDMKPIMDLVTAALIEQFGVDKTKWPKNIRNPFRSGKEKDYDGYDENIIFATASSVKQPGVVDRKIQQITDPNEFYGGCYAIAKISVYGYDKAGNKGVAFGLRNVLKTRDGEQFAGGSKPEDDFASIAVPAAQAGETLDPLGSFGS